MSQVQRTKRHGRSILGEPGPEWSVIGSARDRACSFVAHRAAWFPSFDPRPLNTAGLEARDAALAHAIVDGAGRRYLTLAHLVGRGCSRPFEALEPKLKGALLVGAAQLFLLDRVPAYAALDHAVEWTKRAANRGAAGFVNAVLRSAARLRAEGAEPQALPGWRAGGAFRNALPLPSGLFLRLTEPVFPEEEWAALALATGHPPQLIETWRGAFGDDRARALALHGVARAPVILNTQNAEFLPLPSESVRAHTEQGYSVYSGDHDSIVATLDGRDDVWVQDPASGATVRSVEGAQPPPARIIDVCAGQGTKTRQLARTFPSSRIIATDTDPRRHEVLRRVFKGHPRVTVIEHRDLMPEYAGWADLVLLDVPCSNTGVLARRPEAKHRFNRRAIEELTGIQRQIIADAIPLLSDSPGAAILYGTCSLDQRENDAQAAWAVEWHGLERGAERLTLPAGGPGEDPLGYHDGGYSVLLKRPARGGRGKSIKAAPAAER
ncbi:MAG: transcription antitermination factor NusB [Phycisphaerales bacterium]